MREIKAGTSYLSGNDLRVHFGLGSSDHADWAEVRWPNGKVQRMENIAADRYVSIRAED